MVTNAEVLDARPEPRGRYRVDVSQGTRIGRVSSEWFSCPADERDPPVRVGGGHERSLGFFQIAVSAKGTFLTTMIGRYE